MSKGLTPLYHPLEDDKALRFLNLLPGEADGEVCFELIYDSIAQAPPRPYEATSYAWGSPSPVRIVRCDGRPVEIRENAYDFLHRLRLPRRARMLWMDCVCIDQSNVKERAEQVEFMHLIYRRAQSVLIWLGPEADDSALSMAYARQIDAQECIEEIARGNAHGSHYLYKTYYPIDRIVHTVENERLVRSTAAIFDRTWLRRIWVQQEAAMCPDTRVGADSVCNLQYNRVSIIRPVDPWTLENLADEDQQNWLSYHGRPTDFRSNELEQQVLSAWERDLPGRFATLSFANQAHKCSGRQATDPRDKVYALFNLTTTLSKELKEQPPVDYNDPWQVVYIPLAKWLYKWDHTRILKWAGRSVQQESTIPSWVPDWRRRIEIELPAHDAWSAGGAAQQPYIRFLSLPKSFPDPGTMPYYSYLDRSGRGKRIPGEGLELTAVLQDRIVYTGSDHNWQSKYLSQNIPQHQERLSADLRYLEKHEPRYFTGEQTAQAYAATLITNTTHENQLASLEYEREGFAQYQTWLDDGLPDPDPVYFDAIRDFLREHAVCATAHGLMASAPDLVRDGDDIAVLSGFKEPVVLRRVGPPHRDYYELLGDCYIHRMMRGRAWGLIEEFKCKYQARSEDEATDFASLGTLEDDIPEHQQPCDFFPFNPRADYARVIRILGKRRIVLV